jgi:sialic acid synthase SpsE
VPDATLLHCTSAYPAPIEDANLRAMETLRKEFGRPVGLSDHTPGITVPIAAAALGATVIEKHLTLSRDLEGPDHKASLEPREFTAMVKAIREVGGGDGRRHQAAPPLGGGGHADREGETAISRIVILGNGGHAKAAPRVATIARDDLSERCLAACD